MSSPSNVTISLQSLSENKIQEIAYDGRETFIKPLSMSETLTDLANRIDFLNVNNDTTQGDTFEEDAQVFQAKQWPWEGIRTHLHRALIEMNVLVDVLSIAQNKSSIKKESTAENADASRYFMYDLAAKEPEQPKPILQMIAKKKCLSAASKILLNGAERLSQAWSEESQKLDFHSELLKLRQHWRVRRVGDKIIGDVSYKTTGSDFWHNGAFEVIKLSMQEDDSDDTDINEVSLGSGLSLQSPLKVVVSADLRGTATILVSLTDNLSEENSHINETCELNYFHTLDNSVSKPTLPLWHRALLNAQNVLFCKELFARLTKEAIQYRSNGITAPFVVVGNTISTNIFNNTKLTVKIDYSKKVDTRSGSSIDLPEGLYSLRHALFQLLLKHHSQCLNIPPPHPTSAVLGLKPKMRLAAVKPCPGYQLKAISERESESLAESLAKMAKHYVVRRRLMSVIDSLKNQFQDPDVQAHTSIISNMFESSVRITIGSSGFESCFRTLVQLTIKANEIKALQKEGRSIFLSVDKPSLHDYFISLISSHQLLTLQALSRTLGWTLLHMSPHSTLDVSSDLMNRGTILVASPSSDSKVAIVCKTSRDGNIDYDVLVQYCKEMPQSDLELKSVDFSLYSEKYYGLGGDWKKVDWPRVHGRHFIQKMETLLTSLINH